jgi:CRP/FNR family transcriptional regulator, cyclic AMP receptor protein
MTPSTKTFDIVGLLAALGTKGKTVQFPKNRIIFSQGDRSDAIFYIESGNVKLAATSHQGKEAIVGVFEGGDFIGESCIRSDLPARFQTATTITDARLVRIDRDAIVSTLRAKGEVFYVFISSVIRHTMRAQEALANSLLESSEKRLARALLTMYRLNEGHCPPYANITQQNWADMIGITRQRVNVLLKQFRKSGLIEDARGLKVKPNILAILDDRLASGVQPSCLRHGHAPQVPRVASL